MKLIIASDLHGSAYYGKKLIDRMAVEGAEKMLILGDLLYHGPRNDYPDAYADAIIGGLADLARYTRDGFDEIAKRIEDFLHSMN